MRVGVLGPVEVTVDGRELAIDTSKERALLSVLALRADHIVPTATLVDALWGDDPPATAARTLGSHISRLRRVTGPDLIIGDATGYRLRVDPRDVDALAMEELVHAAAQALDWDAPDRGGELAVHALALWRGEPLTDLADGDLRRGEQTRLEELRMEATEKRIVAELALGHHDRILGEIEALVARHPLRESLWGHLMVALYRCGRQADALRAFDRLRHVLVTELGIEPVPAIVRIEHMILHQDPQLDVVPPPPPDNLPATTSSFIGRADEVRRITKDLGERRLVTLVGPGGVGKTRIALEVARGMRGRFPDGIIWIDLAAARESSAVVPGLMRAAGVFATPGVPPDDALDDALRGRQILIVIDNCEHLLPAVRELVGRLLEVAPALKVLATSRVRLGLTGELLRPIPPLRVPDEPPHDLLEVDAVRLFAERAGDTFDHLSVADLGAAAEICRRVDGIPLAIELVASRTNALEPTELAARLEHGSSVLGRGQPLGDPRYDSLRDAIGWSYALLDPPAQILLAHLSVLPSAFDLTTAEAVGAPIATEDELVEIFGQLVDASMVEIALDAGDHRRFRLLETIREFAAEQLDGDDAEDARQRHATHFRELAAALGPFAGRPESRHALTRLERDDANFRAAVSWSLENEPRELALQFGPALGNARQVLGDLDGCQQLLEQLLEGADDAAPDQQAQINYILAWPAVLQGDGARAWALLDRAFEGAAGNSRLVAAIGMARGHALLLGLGDTDAAIPHYEQAIAATGPDEAPVEWMAARLGMAQALVLADRPGGVAELLDDAETRLAKGNNAQLAHLHLDLGLLAWSVGDIDAIPVLAQRGVDLARRAEDSAWEQVNLTALGVGHLLTGRDAEAETPLLLAARLALDAGNLLQLGITLQVLAALVSERGNADAAARLLGAGTTRTPFWPLLRRGLGPLLQPSRTRLAERFDTLVDDGAQLTPEDAVALALRATAP